MYKDLKLFLTFHNHVSALTCRWFLSDVTYPIHLLNIYRWQENQLVYHHVVIYPRPLMLFQLDQQDQLRNGDHKKIINPNKIFLNVFTECIPIFKYCRENWCQVVLDNSINFFWTMCLSDIMFLIEEIILLETFSSWTL